MWIRLRIFGVVACLAIVSTACLDIDGSIELYDSMVFNKKGGSQEKIDSGTYAATLKMNSKKSLTLEIKQEGNKIQIPIKSSHKLDIPKSSGTFTIFGDQIAQPYDVSGEVESQVSDGPTRSTFEECTKQIREVRCSIPCSEDDIRTGRNGCRENCKDIFITRYGKQETVYHDRTTVKHVQFSFLTPGSTSKRADFSGKGTEVEKVVERTGACD